MGVNHPLYFEFKEPRCQALRSDCEPKLSAFFFWLKRREWTESYWRSKSWMDGVGFWGHNSLVCDHVAAWRSWSHKMAWWRTRGGHFFGRRYLCRRPWFVHPSFFCSLNIFSSSILVSWSTFTKIFVILIKIPGKPLMKHPFPRSAVFTLPIT